MLKFTSLSQFSSCSSLQPPYKSAVKNTLQSLCSTLSPDPSDRGFVLFVEEKDTLDDINQACCRDLETSLEGTFIDGNCLIGVVLWGNGGEGVTIVCPDKDGYADEVADVLLKYL